MRISANRWRPLAAPVVAVLLALAVGACGSSATASGGSSGSGPYMSAAQLSALQTMVNQAEQVPSYVSPGPSFDARKAAGKKMLVIPTASQLPVCEQIAHGTVAIAQKVGMTGKVLDNSGGASGWIPGIEQAISQHYNAIVLICGIDPNLITPQLQAAKRAGIAVIDSGLYDSTVQGSQTSPLVTAQTNIPNALSMQQSVAYMRSRTRPSRSTSSRSSPTTSRPAS